MHVYSQIKISLKQTCRYFVMICCVMQIEMSGKKFSDARYEKDLFNVKEKRKVLPQCPAVTISQNVARVTEPFPLLDIFELILPLARRRPCGKKLQATACRTVNDVETNSDSAHSLSHNDGWERCPFHRSTRRFQRRHKGCLVRKKAACSQKPKSPYPWNM